GGGAQRDHQRAAIRSATATTTAMPTAIATRRRNASRRTTRDMSNTAPVPELRSSNTDDGRIGDGGRRWMVGYDARRLRFGAGGSICDTPVWRRGGISDSIGGGPCVEIDATITAGIWVDTGVGRTEP